MTPSYFREIRNDEGLSAEALARILGLSSGRVVRRYEAGDRAIPMPVQILMALIHRHGPGILRLD